MVRIVLDSKCHQAIRHQGSEGEYYRGRPAKTGPGAWRGRRLTGFQDALAERGYGFAISDLSAAMRPEEAILVIAGRAQEAPFTGAEMERIAAFCNHGGSLLLMANHARLVAPQNQIAELLALPVRFHEITVPQDKQRLILDAGHAISKGCPSGLRIRTSCTMTLEDCPSAAVLARNEDPEIGVFAVAMESEDKGRGRTVAMPSAGHIASDDDTHADLWPAASNATWTLNIIEWLAYRL
ncbi:MAG: hypothetical protein ACE15C_10235 [Phycisphaerae bacterium]